MSGESRVIVVGAGVVGLSCAVRLLEAGHRVDVVARDLPLETTSAVAGALWYPYRTLPEDRVTVWAAASYSAFASLTVFAAESGVRMVPGTSVASSTEASPWWADAVPALQATPQGWSFAAPVVDMTVYLPWLVGRIETLGGTVSRLNLAALPSGGDVVVNCSGIGSRLLASDRSVVPVRGQVVVVEQVGLDHWWAESSGPLYVAPRTHDIVVGGTEEEGDWSRTPSPDTAAQIIARASALVPELASARVLRHKVGLRPSRPHVRVEREGRVVHCYGHGGAGVTLSWGCADDVVELVAEA